MSAMVKTSTVQILRGTVAKLSSDQTVKVSIKETRVHPIYKKRYTIRRPITAHNVDLTLQVGDQVCLRPCRPISKSKRWLVASRLTEAQESATIS